MKIIFICGSLEPGKDGVGDYTRRLAGAIINKGHFAGIVALYDSFISKEENGHQLSGKTKIPILRLPIQLKDKARFITASQYIKIVSPDWISLQLVLFSYHRKGLPFLFYRHLNNLGYYKWHIMFHELWVGAYGETSLKLKILGLLQKYIINQLLHTLNPDYVTTHLELYKNKLSWESVNLLPLFSNMPIYPTSSGEKSFSEKLTAIHFGTFSGFYKDFKNQMIFLSDSASKSNKKPILLILGNGGRHKEKALGISKEILGSENVVDLGPLSEEMVSHYFHQSDIGVSRSDFPLYGKSGTTIAMLEHGLPVLLRGRRPKSEHLKFSNFDKQLVFSDDNKLINSKSKPHPLLNQICNTFLDDLKEIEEKKITRPNGVVEQYI